MPSDAPAVNVDRETVHGFGEEWSRFTYEDATPEMRAAFDTYFLLFPWDKLPPNAVGFDFGCGSGRWARFAGERVGHLHCIDASPAAIATARRNLTDADRFSFAIASAEDMPLPDGSMDFGYSLGVLHHIPDSQSALDACVRKLKPGAPFLVYIYYAFDDRPGWFRLLWKISDVLRRVISRSPTKLRYLFSQLIAATVYFPLSRTARLLERAGFRVDSFPLAFYRNYSFYVLRNDALDRFGTRLEQRFRKDEIEAMMRRAGLTAIAFSKELPHWTAIGYRDR